MTFLTDCYAAGTVYFDNKSTQTVWVAYMGQVPFDAIGNSTETYGGFREIYPGQKEKLSYMREPYICIIDDNNNVIDWAGSDRNKFTITSSDCKLTTHRNRKPSGSWARCKNQLYRWGHYFSINKYVYDHLAKNKFPYNRCLYTKLNLKKGGTFTFRYSNSPSNRTGSPSKALDHSAEEIRRARIEKERRLREQKHSDQVWEEHIRKDEERKIRRELESQRQRIAEENKRQNTIDRIYQERELARNRQESAHQQNSRDKLEEIFRQMGK